MITLITGMGFSADQLRYNFQTSIEFSGGYVTFFKDYDFGKNGTSFRQANGDIEQSLTLMQHKMDPLNQKNFSYSYVGTHAASLRVPKSAFKTVADLKRKVNQIGSVFILGKDGKDLLVEKNTDSQATNPFKRKSMKDYLGTNIRHTINDQVHRKPIVAMSATAACTDLIKKEGNSIHIWNDIGLMLNQMRNDWQDTSRFQKIYRGFVEQFATVQREYRNYPQLIEDVHKLFDFDSKTVTTYHNMLEYSGIHPSKQQRAKLFADLKWRHKASDFYINPFASEVQRAEQPLVALEPVVNRIYTQLFSHDQQEQYASFLVNAENIKQQTPLQAAGGVLKILTSTEARSIVLAALLQSGISHHVFRVYASNSLAPSLNQSLLITALAIIGIVALGFVLYLISYFRAMALVMIIGFSFSLVFTLFLMGALGLLFSPISIIAFLVTMGTVGSGLVLAMRRYQFEKVTNNLANLVAFKIVLRQIVPYLLSGLVIFMMLALVFYWLTTGSTKDLATLTIVNLAVSAVTWFGGTLLAFWLLLHTTVLQRWSWLDVARVNPLLWVRDNLRGGGKALLRGCQTHWRRVRLWLHKQPPQQTVVSERPASSSLVVADQKVTARRHWFNFRGQLKRSFVVTNLLLMGLLLVVGGVLLGTKKANLDQSLRQSAVFYFSSEVWQQSDYHAEVKFIQRIANGEERPGVPATAHPWNLKQLQTVFSLGTVQQSQSASAGRFLPAILIATNIHDANQARRFQEWLGYASKFQSQDVPTGISWDFLRPVRVGYRIVKIVTACLAGTAVVFVFVTVRYNWAYALATILSGGVTLLISLALVSSLYFLIAMPTVAVLIATWWFALINNGFIISRGQNNLRFYHLPEYQRFFTTHYQHQQVLKTLRRLKRFDSWCMMRRHIRLALLTHPAWTRRQAQQFVLRGWLHSPADPYFLKFQAQMRYAHLRPTYRKFEQQHNFLNQVANRTIKDLGTQFLSLTGFLLIVLTVLAVFSGANAFFFLVTMVGVLLAVYCCFALTILVWVRLESQRSLHKVRLNLWLERNQLEHDEQTVAGVNEVQF